MNKPLVLPAPPSVTLIDEDEIDFRMTASGERSPGDPCHLRIAVEGAEPISFLESAGGAAPRQIRVDVSVAGATGRVVADALSMQPWHFPDAPLIAFAGEHEQAFGYLVRNGPIDELIRLIRTALDLPPGMPRN